MLILFLLFIVLSIFVINNNSNRSFKNPLSSKITKYVYIFLGEGFKNMGYVSVLNDKQVSDVIKLYSNNYSELKVTNYAMSSKIFEGQKLQIVDKKLTEVSTKSNNAKPINLCTIDDLKQAAGVGDKTALLIHNYIKENPNLKSSSELIVIKGVGEKTVNEIKKYCY